MIKKPANAGFFNGYSFFLWVAHDE